MPEVKPKEVQPSVERVPGTLSTASKSVQVNGAATVRIDFFFSFSMLTPSQTPQSNQIDLSMNKWGASILHRLLLILITDKYISHTSWGNKCLIYLKTDTGVGLKGALRGTFLSVKCRSGP